MNDDRDDQNDDEVSQEVTQGNNPVRPRRGRPAQPRAETINAMEARLEAILSGVENEPDVEARSIDDIIEYNRKLMTKIQNIMMKDLKTIDVRNVARVTTPNGLAKQDLGGLPDGTRMYLMKLYEQCNKALSLAEAVQKDDTVDPDKKFQVLADKLYRGVPGLKLTKN